MVLLHGFLYPPYYSRRSLIPERVVRRAPGLRGGRTASLTSQWLTVFTVTCHKQRELKHKLVAKLANFIPETRSPPPLRYLYLLPPRVLCVLWVLPYFITTIRWNTVCEQVSDSGNLLVCCNPSFKCTLKGLLLMTAVTHTALVSYLSFLFCTLVELVPFILYSWVC